MPGNDRRGAQKRLGRNAAPCSSFWMICSEDRNEADFAILHTKVRGETNFGTLRQDIHIIASS